MATTDARSGFRLPWSSDDRETDQETDAGDAADTEQATDDTNPGATDGSGSHATSAVEGVAAANEDPATGGDPTADRADSFIAVADLPVGNPLELHVAESDRGETTGEAASTIAPSVADASPADGPRRSNRLMADLAKAMRDAAESARQDALTRLQSDAASHVEQIQARSAEGSTDLRRRADEDISAIRDWSKTEIARIREETEQRISARKEALEREIDDHTALIGHEIERVQGVVNDYEATVAEFFQRLLGEEDPSRIAALAEHLPEAPTLDATSWQVPDRADAPAVDGIESDAPGQAEAETSVSAPFDVGDDPRLAALGFTPDFAAAEAEAAAAATIDSGTPETASDEIEVPIIGDDALAARLQELAPERSVTQAQARTTDVIVSGLISVASIAGFKRQLSRIDGVQFVGVSSGPDGEFVFSAAHVAELDLASAIASISAFDARVTSTNDGVINVTAHDPESDR